MDSVSFFRQLTTRLQEFQVEKGMTKRSALRMSIAGLISENCLQEDMKLPSEREIAQKTGLSLGTVQVALSQLRDLGLVSRRQGDGTRVKRHGEFDKTARHFRFRSKESGLPMRMTESKTQVKQVSIEGPWTLFLGADAEILSIQRQLVMDGCTPVYAEMYLDKLRYMEIEHMNPSELDFVNIRVMLARKAGVNHTTLRNRLRTVFVPQKLADKYGLALSGYYFKVSSWVETQDHNPMYYHDFLFNMNDCELEF